MTALITPKETLCCKEPVIFIDTRAPEDFAAGHIPGAINMREIFTYVSMSTDPDLSTLHGKFARLFGDAGLSGKERAVFYEDDMDAGNGQSCRGYFLLKYLGYPNVSVLRGGFKAWLQAGLQVTKDKTFTVPATFPISVNTEMMVTKQEMLAALGNPNIAVIDVRDVDEWEGDFATPSGQEPELRAGRIPGARWMEWRKMLTSESNHAVFHSKDEIIRLCAEIGLTPSTPTYLYCFKGSRAASTYVALKAAGFSHVRNYFASWNEWGRDLALPIDASKKLSRADD